jgi:proteic killer suppression protein
MDDVIISFADKRTEQFWTTGRSKNLPADVRRVALRKLLMLNEAVELSDLAVPPGNHLEALHGDREGQHSIRINDRLRICFA